MIGCDKSDDDTFNRTVLDYIAAIMTLLIVH